MTGDPASGAVAQPGGARDPDAGQGRARHYDAFVSAVTNECGKARDSVAAALRMLELRVAVRSDLQPGPADTSLLRGVPWINRLLLRNLPESSAPPAFERGWIALLLTLQMFLGGLIGIAAQGFLAYAVIGLALPWFGLDLLHLAREAAALNLPGHLLSWLTGLPPP